MPAAVLKSLGRLALAREHDLRLQDQVVQGRAQFMAHRGQKFGFCPQRHFRPVSLQIELNIAVLKGLLGGFQLALRSPGRILRAETAALTAVSVAAEIVAFLRALDGSGPAPELIAPPALP